MENQNTQDRKFKIQKLEERIAPKILQVNGGGNVPNGEADSTGAFFRLPPWSIRKNFLSFRATMTPLSSCEGEA